MWSSQSHEAMKIKFLTIAHDGQAGHLGADATVAAVGEQLVRTGITTDAREFVFSCFLCVLSRNGATVLRPLSQTFYSTKPNDVLHFDHFFVGKSDIDEKYVFVVKGDFSGYAWVTSTAHTTAQHTVETLSRWRRTFKAPSHWVWIRGHTSTTKFLRT